MSRAWPRIANDSFHQRRGEHGATKKLPQQGVFTYATFKPFCEFLLALILLILTAPVILVAGIIVVLTSRGPPFYSQIRVGRNRIPYRIYKIRTMYHHCEKLTGPKWATVGDPRITGVGRFLRYSHIDELPQLWNVLRGEMSLVGPRPERIELIGWLEKAVPHYHERLLVRPGLTGLAQVHLPPDTNLESVCRKVAYDRYYVKQLTLWLDMRIIISTVGILIGVPLNFQRKLLGVPGGEWLERAYPSHC